jgi:hypothetical protein
MRVPFSAEASGFFSSKVHPNWLLGSPIFLSSAYYGPLLHDGDHSSSDAVGSNVNVNNAPPLPHTSDNMVLNKLCTRTTLFSLVPM